MSSAVLQNPIFTDNDKAREWLERRIWATGRVCPHCGRISYSTPLKGEKHRPGLYQCNDAKCREQFTVTVGTVFERSKIPLSKWLAALFLMVASKKGVSAHQVHRMLGISYKSTWFMMHRLREAMRSGDLSPMGGEGQTVEVDETFIGRKKGVEANPGWVKHKHTVLTLVERGGSVRSFHIDEATKENIVPIVNANLDRESHLMTDEARRYEAIGKEFASHGVVDHSRKEYGYTDRKTGAKVNTNTVEGYYSIFKRGMKGVYQHCSEKHLHRYLAEFDFRYSNRSALGIEDRERADILAIGIVGKRLTYRRPDMDKRP
jgi:transposase-like protein